MAQLHRGDTHLYFWYSLCADILCRFCQKRQRISANKLSEIQGSKLQKLSKKYKLSYFLGHRVETPWPIRKKFGIKTCASLSPKYWTTFDDAQAKTKGSCPIHENEYPHPKKMFNPPPLGPPSTERPQKRRILWEHRMYYTLRIWCRSPHAFPRYGLRNISPLTSM